MALPPDNDILLWLALLHELDQAGGQAKPLTIYPRMQKYFPSITTQDLQLTVSVDGSRSKWINTIQWARERLFRRGCIDNSQPGTWILTTLGKQWLDANWQGPRADYSRVQRPALVRSAGPPTKRAPKLVAPATKPATVASPPHGAGNIAVVTPAPANPSNAVPSSVTRLIQDLQTSQRQSQTPLNYEVAITDAFNFLGFDATHLGGSGNTDISIQALLGQASYSAVIDAKTTQSGKVSDSLINWPAIGLHRQRCDATYAMVVGEAFSGGQLQQFANQYKMTLLTTAMLCDLLRMHATAPFNLYELKDLFSDFGLATSVMRKLQGHHERNQHHWRLIAEIISTIEKIQQGMSTSLVAQANNLHFYLGLNGNHALGTSPTLQDVTDALAFLASPAMKILVEVPGSNGAYQLAMRGATAQRRLAALASFFDSTPNQLANPVAASVSQGVN